MKTRISRRLFLGGAALLGAGIALDRVGQTPMPVNEQREVSLAPTNTSTGNGANRAQHPIRLCGWYQFTQGGART